jgi:hypothetical protein
MTAAVQMQRGQLTKPSSRGSGWSSSDTPQAHTSQQVVPPLLLLLLLLLRQP